MIFFQSIFFPKELLQCIGYISSYLPKLNSSLDLVFGPHYLYIFSKKIFQFYISIDEVSISELSLLLKILNDLFLNSTFVHDGVLT